MAIESLTSAGQAPILLDGSTLTPKRVALVARQGAPAALSPEAHANNDRAREAIASLLARGDELYGVTTGVGALRAYRVPKNRREQYSLSLLRSHACGAGPPLPAQVVRAAMVTRANQIGAGGAGVARELLDAIVNALNAGLSPFTRELGSLGTGDLTNLADIALALLGEGQVWRGDELVDAATALADAGLEPARLGGARRPCVHELQRGQHRARRAARGRRAPAARRMAVGRGAVVRGGGRRPGRARPADPLVAPPPRSGGGRGADARAARRGRRAYPRPRAARRPGPVSVPRPAAGRRHRPRRAPSARGDRRARAQLRRRERADRPRRQPRAAKRQPPCGAARECDRRSADGARAIRGADRGARQHAARLKPDRPAAVSRAPARPRVGRVGARVHGPCRGRRGSLAGDAGRCPDGVRLARRRVALEPGADRGAPRARDA